MPVQTRARAKATDKPPSPLKNILKAPARRAAKAKATSSTKTADTKITKEALEKTTKAVPKPVRSTHEQSKRFALTTSRRGRKAKIEEELEAQPEAMEVDQVMADVHSLHTGAGSVTEDGFLEAMVMDICSAQQTPAKESKIPRPSPKLSPATATQPTPARKENTPLRHKISVSRLAKTAVVKKPSREGLLSRSPLKSSLSLQSLLSAKKPKNTSQLSAADTNLFTFSKAPPVPVDAPFMEDDVFLDQPIEPIFKYSSILSPEKPSFASPRKPAHKEKLLAGSPSRKNTSPERRHSPVKTPPRSPPTSPERMLGSMMHFSSLFPGVPSSPASSPDHPATRGLSSPRDPLSEIGSPTVPPRSSSKSPKKHGGDPLTSRSPSKVPRLSPSKNSLRSCESVSGVPPCRLSASQRMSQSPSKSSMRSPTKQKSAPTLSLKKSVTWNDTQVSGHLPYPDPSLLLGYVFYVDVRTAEGDDAGPLFVPLLKDMGASVVSQWTSNSMNVTHVLFKDGNDRTLEKVVASNGAVKCVNVGWAVDCERSNKRLPEHDYAIDLSRIPGQTPTTTPRARPLSPIATNDPGTANPVPQTPLPQTSLNINNAKISITTPAFLAGSKTVGAKSTFNHSFQPSLSQIHAAEEDKENVMPEEHPSPETPYFLHPQDLVQKTCPPKPSLQAGLDAGSDKKSSELKHKLLLAKRKSLEWAPRVSSPLRLSSGGEEF